MEEEVSVEREFAERLKLDAADLGDVQTAASFKQAVGYLEGAPALTNTLTFFHAGAQWASQEFGLVLKSGTHWVSPLGHVWIFGGGYVEGLDNTIIATSQPYGWRDEPQIRTTMDTGRNLFVAIAERTVVIGYAWMPGRRAGRPDRTRLRNASDETYCTTTLFSLLPLRWSTPGGGQQLCAAPSRR